VLRAQPVKKLLALGMFATREGLEFAGIKSSGTRKILDIHGRPKFGAWSPHFPIENGYLFSRARSSKSCEFSAKFGEENDCIRAAENDVVIPINMVPDANAGSVFLPNFCAELTPCF
jgi:hypothetical protein